MKRIFVIRASSFHFLSLNFPLKKKNYFYQLTGIFKRKLVFTETLGTETGVSLMDYMFDTDMGIGWFRGIANPSGIAVLALLAIMAVFSHRMVRKSGHFEVNFKPTTREGIRGKIPDKRVKILEKKIPSGTLFSFIIVKYFLIV